MMTSLITDLTDPKICKLTCYGIVSFYEAIMENRKVILKHNNSFTRWNIVRTYRESYHIFKIRIISNISKLKNIYKNYISALLVVTRLTVVLNHITLIDVCLFNSQLSFLEVPDDSRRIHWLVK